MKDWSESWRAILLVIFCCIIFSSVFGMGLALILQGNLVLPQWNLSDLFSPFDRQASDTMSTQAVEPEPRVPDWVMMGVSVREETAVVAIAKKYLGVPYLFGGELERDGKIDCSSFTVLVFKQLGINLPRTTYGQVQMGHEIETIEDMLPGDLIFFENTSSLQTGVTHVGIYIGNRNMIHASFREGEVAITSINDPFYVEHWHSMRRILE